MISRRQVVLALGAGAMSATFLVLAQQERRVRRIGYFSSASASTNASWLDAFREGMTELRWIEGRDYAIDARYADGVSQAAPDLATKLIATQPDLLLTPGDNGTRTLAQRTKTIPIVFALASDPVGLGVAASLPRPGGNATGLTALARDLGAKRLQLLKEAFPRIGHVVVLFTPNAGGLPQVKEIEEAASRLKIRVTPIELRQAADIEPAFKRGAALHADAYMMTQGFLVNNQYLTIADRLRRSKVPAIFTIDEHAIAGALMSYGPSFRDNFRRAAGYADKILKGAKPGDLPIEQPTKYALIVNLKTARALGLTIPQSILQRADRVID